MMTSVLLILAAQHWAFKQPRTLDFASIDSFIVAELKRADLSPAPHADRRTLARRAAYDLTGLPPDPDLLAAFVADESPDAFARLVDTLLASPRFGERWARHWLDLARYADTKEWVVDEERRLPFAYTYRDWIISAFNDDLPYDRFVVSQIAADLEPEPRPLAALGFLTVGRTFLNQQHDIVADRIDVVTRGLMGMTVDCARCHDHFYDPIPTADYYSLYGIFASSKLPPLSELPLLAGTPPGDAEVLKALAEKEAKLSAFREERRAKMIAEARKPEKIAAYIAAARELIASEGLKPRDLARKHKLNARLLERWAEQLKKSPDALRSAPPEEVAGHMREEPFEEPEREAMRLAIVDVTAVPADKVDEFLQEDDRDGLRKLKKELDALHAKPGAPARAMALREGDPVSPTVFVRGDPGSSGPAVPRRFLSSLGVPTPEGIGRLELARAIVSPDNPLTARVWVNRVWMHLLGEGLVRTPSDFGTRGDRPTHPELLDHLAVSFVRDGQSLKALLRRIMASSVYQQAGREVAAFRERDPENRLLWRANRRRLDYEALHDSLLSVAGALDPALGGPPTGDPLSTRRAIYAVIDRLNMAGVLKTFDVPMADQHSPKRHETTIPQQALFLMNSPFALDQAKRLAARTEGAADRIGALYRFALGRDPTTAERDAGRNFGDDWNAYAQVLMISNEFAFLD